MPEGPSIVLLREAAAKFKGKTVREVSGNSTLDLACLQGRRVRAVRSWGKHFLLEFSHVTLRIHLMMFGSWRIDERKETPARVSMRFDNGELNFYTCSVKLIAQPLDEVYDWRSDVMSDLWDPRLARRRLKSMPDVLVCDALLDQTLFSGVGNIIKQERGAVPHPGPSGQPCRRCSAAQACRTGQAGPRIQFRLPAMEARVRAEKALAGAHPADMSPLWWFGQQGLYGYHASAHLLLPGVPD
ncbi:Endonuclease 8 [compost metagenome]